MMLRDILRTLGAGCIIAGAIIYFTDGGNSKADSTKDHNVETNEKLKTELQHLQSQLAETKDELARIQLASSTSNSPKEGTVNQNKGEPDVEEEPEKSSVSTELLIKTVLIIESGANSGSVANSLTRSGILNDSAEFETYLEKNGLSGRIQIGEYDLDSSMDMKMIANIITTSR